MKSIKNILSRTPLSLLLAVLFVFFTSPVMGEVTSTAPSNYYASADGTTGNALRTALYNIIKGHTVVSYDNLKYLMKYSDTKDADGTHVVDIYSDCEYTSGTTSLSWVSSGNVGAGMNREHTVPQSWFSEDTPMVGDAFHIYPTDSKANNNRSSFLYGEVDSTKTMTQYTGTSGGKTYHELGAKGTSKWSSSSKTLTYTLNGKTYTTTAYYSGTIYEPDDEYKGDIARGYFYMATRYAATGSGNDNCSNWTGGAFGSDNNGMTNYTAQLMLKWHRQDPVSEKELIRNEVIYGNTTYNKGSYKQSNRNPFIDYPCLVEYIWGDSVGKNVDFSKLVSAYSTSFSGQGCPCENSTDPTITLSTSSLTMDPTASGSSSSKTFTVTGAYLTGAISISKNSGGSSFISISPSSSISSGYNGTTTITVTYSPTSTGTHTATFTFSSSGATSKKITITGTCATVYTATWMANGSQFHQNTAASGSAPDMPSDTPDDCSGSGGKKFVGWTAHSSVSGSVPDDLFTSSAPTITSDTTFYAVYATAATSGGGSSPVEKTITFSSQGYNNEQAITTVTMDNCTLTFAQGTGSNAPKYYTSGSAVRCYKNNTLTVSSDYTITSIVVSTVSGYAGTITASAGSYSSGTWTGNSTSVTLTNAPSDNSQWRITTIAVTTNGSGGTTTYSDYSTSCTTGPTVTVTFHSNYGTETTTTQTIPQSTNTALTANTFSRTHYTFAGWATSANGGVVYADGATVNFGSNMDLYAKWTEDSQYTVTFMNNGATHATKSGYAGATITGVSDPTPCDGYTFVGWSTETASTETTTSPTIDYTGTIPSANTTYYAVFSRTEGSGSSSTVTDNITLSTTGVTSGSTTYSNWTATGTSGAGYSGNSAGGNASIQMRSNNSNSGIVTTTSGGTASNITVTWLSNDGNNNRTVNVYGKNTAYSAASDLYSSSTQGTLLGSATYGTSTSIDVSGSYSYIGLRSSSGALYLTNVAVTWSTGSGSTTYYTTSPSCAVATYTITWKDGDGNTLKTEDVAAGSTPSYSGSTPTKTATAQYTYTFNNSWSPTIVAATEDAIYTAQFNSTVRQYNIIWKNEDGTSTLETDENQNYGTATAFNGSTPTKAATAQYTYTFDGWATTANGAKAYNNGSTPTVSGTATYYAHFSSTLRSYIVTFKDKDGGTLKTQTVNYGSAATAPSIPDVTCYTGTWDKAFNNITSDLIVTATYTIIPYTITASPDNAGHGSASASVAP